MTTKGRRVAGLAWRGLLFRLLGVACALLVGGTLAAAAQPPEPWSDPIMVSSGLLDEAGQPLSCSFPTMAADPWGSVHLFWTRLPREGDVDFQGLLFYSRWDGQTWTPPIDVLTQSPAFWLPQVVADMTGRLHLAWLSGYEGVVLYSSAPIETAGSAKAWTTPVQVSEVGATGFGLAVDRSQRAHIVFCSGGEDDRCYHTASTDGSAWTTEVSIHSPCPDCTARVAVDGAGRIHTIFGSQSTAGETMYYSRSVDGGQNWLAAQELDRSGDRFGENYGPSWGTVAAAGLDEVHLVWYGAPSGQRWHRWSSDGGATWSEAQQISADQRGLTLPVATAFDSAGSLHLVSMGWRDVEQLPSGAFHFAWQAGRWSVPQLIGSRSDWDAEYAAAAIAGGNRLVAAWTDKEGPKETYQIWASTLQVDASPIGPATQAPAAIPSALPPAEQPSAEPSAAVTGVVAARTPSSPSSDLSTEGLGATSAKSEWIPYLLGVLPPMILVALILVVRAARQSRGG